MLSREWVTRINPARRTLALMLAGMTALLVIVGTSIWLASRTNELAAEVIRAREIRTLASEIQILMLDAETGQRGYLLTGDANYLAPYESAKPVLKNKIERLRALVERDEGRESLAVDVGSVVDAKLAELAETTKLAMDGRRDEALAVVKTNAGKAAMDRLRDILRDLIADLEAGVAKRLDVLSANARTLAWTTVGGGALIVAFAVGALWTVARYTRELVAAGREVKALNEGLEERVAERTTDLTRANDEIQRFAYIVSHDLRSPLVNIMGFTSELEAGTSTLQMYLGAENPTEELAQTARTVARQELPEAVSFIRASTAKMDRLINAILKLSREGRRELNVHPVDLDALLRTAGASVQHQLDEAGARFELVGSFPRILSDRLALEQVLGNVIDNAVKYLVPGRPGLITVKAAETRNRIQVLVSDNGRGIAAQDHERIFELFRRSGTQDRPGEGIGLAHVRALVRRLGGDITVQSQLGEGTTFQIDLPKRLILSEKVAHS